MDLTTQMVQPITDVISNNLPVLIGVVITIVSASLLFKFVRRAAR